MNVADGGERLKHDVLNFGLAKLLSALLPFLQLLVQISLAVFEHDGDFSGAALLIRLCTLIADLARTNGKRNRTWRLRWASLCFVLLGSRVLMNELLNFDEERRAVHFLERLHLGQGHGGTWRAILSLEFLDSDQLLSLSVDALNDYAVCAFAKSFNQLILIHLL